MGEHHNAAEDGKALRKLLARNFEQPFLWRLCLDKLSKDYTTVGPRPPSVVYHNFFTDRKLDRDKLKQKVLGNNRMPALKVLSQQVTDDKISKYIQAVMKQRPHDLNKVLGNKKINRFSMLNSNLATPRSLSTPIEDEV